MAILVYFEKARENEQEVEYLFGFPDQMDRRLVIHKASQGGRPLDGDRNHAFGGAFVKIVRYYKSRASWPEKGAYAA